MTPDQYSLKRSAIVSTGVMVLLLAGALVFYKERMLFTDASLITFRRINLQDLQSSQRRYGAFITEAVPLVLSWLHLPLRAILIAYSCSFNLLYLGVNLLLVFRYRQYAFAILMAFYYTLFVSDGYFWTNNEIHQAVAYLFLTLGLSAHLAQRAAPPLLQLAVFTVGAVLTIFTHPLAIIAFGFLWVFLMLTGIAWPYTKKQALLYSVILFLIIMAKLLLSGHQDYDARRMDGVVHPTLSLLTHVCSNGVSRPFFSNCLTNYWWAIIIFITGAIALARKGKYPALAWVVLSAAGFFMLVSLAFGQGTFLYYLEGEWALLGIIVAAPFVYYVLPRLRPAYSAVFLCVVFLTRIGYMLHSSGMFTKRVAYIESLLTHMRSKGLTKVVIKARDGCPEGDLLMVWGLATESMTLSALDGEYPQRTVCALWPGELVRVPQSDKVMIWNFDSRPAHRLNPCYFALDTSRPYTVMTYEELIK